MTNLNITTGIPFGYIALNSLESWVFDELAQAPNPALNEALAEYARDTLRNAGIGGDDCGNPIEDIDDDDAIELADQYRPGFSDRFYDGLDMDLVGVETEIDGVTVAVSELGGAYNLFILESPATGKYRPCSPCVPGAGDLDSPDNENGLECYDVPANWRYTDSDA